MGEIVHPAFGATRRVTLAREGSFTVGRLAVHPSTRQIGFARQQQTVEPRVLQVLVALARAGGEVVSKDELIHCCWDGRIVGEDAINRVISRLRHIAQEIGGGSFKVETIRGVGYRLVEGEPAATVLRAEARAPGNAPSAVSRRTLVAGSAVAVAAGAAFWLLPRNMAKPAPLALQYYQRGLATRGQNSLEQSERGAALFREATRIDPNFADAWGALAWSYRGLLEYPTNIQEPARLLALSRAAAIRALELDPDNADAQAALLLAKPFYRNWSELEAGCRRLLERHPDNSILQFNLGHCLTQVGRWREAVPFLRAVAERERFWPLPQLAWAQALFESRRLQEAEDLIEEGRRRFPGHIDLWLMKVRNLAVMGRQREAKAFIADIGNRPAERSAVQPEMEFEIALVEALADGSAKARDDVMARASQAARQFPTYIGHAAVTAALVGKIGTSFEMLEGYYFGQGAWAFARKERPRTGQLFIRSTRNLRTDARFQQLVSRIGLEDYWRSSGTAPDFRRFPD